MQHCLTNKRIVLGVTGGIAAYKSADLTRRLRDAGCSVRVVMTAKAKEFITPLTMQAVSGNPVHEDLFDLQAEAAMGHIELARWADAIVVAPASANFMARFAKGEGSDLLSTLCLAAQCPIALAPAMNQAMWKNTLTQLNLQALMRRSQLHLFEPANGLQACGDTGPGRMMEPADIVKQLATLFANGLLSGKKVLITAGPTREPIDPVRYISNLSSGKMGYALAKAAIEAGAKVTLISGPVALPKPDLATTLDVITAKQMHEAVTQHIYDCDIFFSVAAVCDYSSETIATQKLKKQQTLNLNLVRNPDILQSVTQLANKPIVIGFAAESENLLENATLKLNNKNADMIIANSVVEEGIGPGSDDNSVTAIWQSQQKHFPRIPKQKLARELIQLVAQELLN